MTLMPILFFVSVALELLIYLCLWRIRHLLYVLALPLGLAASLFIAMQRPNGLTVLLVVLILYRCGNALRVLLGRMQPKALKNMARLAGLHLALWQLVIFGLEHAARALSVTSKQLWLLGSILMFVCAAIIFLQLSRTLRRIRPILSPERFSDKELPSITVAIPARNETTELENILESIVASTYPKLEVIVLDDCSQNKRTPEIIRGYAQRGVRFLAGSTPSDDWLAKNYAYQQLLDAASGEFIVFMGVDIALDASSLRKLVTEMLIKKKAMMSVVPLRSSHAIGHYTLTQPMRYFWELAPPRRLFNRPPALSSCWIISREKLLTYGGFKAISRSITPEAFFARQAIKDDDSYRFSLSSDSLGVRSSKSAAAQRQTALRTRYPQLHRRLELVALFAVIELFTLAAPFALLVVSIFVSLSVVVILLAAGSAALLMASAIRIAFATNVNPPLFAGLSFPFVVLHDVWLLHESAYKYEFSEIEWKGRNVCQPVMQVIPHLPKI